MVLALSSSELARLVTDELYEDDELAAALTCRLFRDALLARRTATHQRPLFVTSVAAAVASARRVAWAVHDAHCVLYGAVALAAAARGNVPVLARLHTLLGDPWMHQPVPSAPDHSSSRAAGSCCMERAAEGGHLPACRYLQSLGVETTERVAEYAARAGRLRVLGWLIDIDCPLHARIACAAAEAGQLGACQLLHARGAPINLRWLGGSALRAGQAKILHWIVALADGEPSGCGPGGPGGDELVLGLHCDAQRSGLPVPPALWQAQSAQEVSSEVTKPGAHGRLGPGSIELLAWLETRAQLAQTTASRRERPAVLPMVCTATTRLSLLRPSASRTVDDSSAVDDDDGTCPRRT